MKFRYWGPKTISHNLPNAQFCFSKITPPYTVLPYCIMNILLTTFLGQLNVLLFIILCFEPKKSYHHQTRDEIREKLSIGTLTVQCVQYCAAHSSLRYTPLSPLSPATPPSPLGQDKPNLWGPNTRLNGGELF